MAAPVRNPLQNALIMDLRLKYGVPKLHWEYRVYG
jgi:hypothetical protein